MGKKTRKQQLAQLAREQAARHHVSHIGKRVAVAHVSKVSNPAKAPRNAAQESLQVLAAPDVPLQQASKTSPDSPALPVSSTSMGSKTNLLLKDQHSGDPLLMRISPTSLYKRRQANKLAAEGLQLLQKLQSAVPTRETRGLFEIGIYHSVGGLYLGFTHDNKAERTRKEASELLRWARDHSRKFLLSVHTLLPTNWKHDMQSREGGPRKFLERVFGRQAALLSPWWTTVTFFDGYTGKPHIDPSDHQPSFLFNFGAPCFLNLHNYDVKVQLDHLDIAVFNTKELRHSTDMAEGRQEERWAFSAYYRQSVYLEKGPSQLGSSFLDTILGVDEVETRVWGANR